MAEVDLTIIYSSAGKIPKKFAANLQGRLSVAAGPYPIYLAIDPPEKSSISNYYRTLLDVAYDIDTPYIAFAEDDTLYSDEHFRAFRPPLDTFAYNFSRWNIYTWSNPPFYSLRQRRILAGCIAPRIQFIDWMEERLSADPKGERLEWWGEPGRNEHEKALGVSHQKSTTFLTYSPLVVFTHPNAFGYLEGKKQAGKIRAFDIPYHGKAKDIIKLYEE